MTGIQLTEAPVAWRHFSKVYPALRPPLKPSERDVQIAANAIRGHSARVLLLGVTPELSLLGENLTAVDNAPQMLSEVWPGDRTNRRAMLADWTKLPFEAVSFNSVLGDGALNSAPEQVGQVLSEVRRMLKPGGRAALRVFCSPSDYEKLTSIRDDVFSGSVGNIHALKWRIAMSLSASHKRRIVPVREILEAFNRLFEDRVALAAATGWDQGEISTLDAYDGAEHSLRFPTLGEFVSLIQPLFSTIRVVGSSGYPLAERCPTIVATA